MPKTTESDTDKPVTKIYWSISEVADMLNISDSCIRYWEKEFDLVIRKNGRDRRGFGRALTVENIEELRFIKHLLDDKGRTLKGARLIFYEARKEDLRNAGTPIAIYL